MGREMDRKIISHTRDPMTGKAREKEVKMCSRMLLV